MLTPAEVAVLKGIARDAVRAAAEGREAPAPPSPLPEPLTRPGAAFVTLKREGELRGCIGHIEATRPLWQSVREMAAEAATDPRFAPVSASEVDALSIEISALTPMTPVADPAEIVIGRDGLYLRQGPHSGLLLPQVAVEWKFDRETFLRETCRKAGLGPEAWKEPDARLCRFAAEIY